VLHLDTERVVWPGNEESENIASEGMSFVLTTHQ
jgi:hypothetical protein